MTELRLTLLTDGSSDRILLRHVEWLLVRHLPPHVAVQPVWADLRAVRAKHKSLRDRIALALDLYPCDVLFVHRDAEKESPQRRHEEIKEATKACRVDGQQFISVVPVRMQEAWLLFDESAIRAAAGNPNGTMALKIPALKTIEAIPDPKAILRLLLRSATGFSGRRLKKFDDAFAVRRVADYIEDFSPLSEVPAFALVESAIVAWIRAADWK